MKESKLDRNPLVEKSRDPNVSLEERIAAGRALGEGADPRFEEKLGTHGSYIDPQMVEIAGGSYPIGDDKPVEWQYDATEEEPADSGRYEAHMPRHSVAIDRFSIGRFPVTNREWACFVEAGAYSDPRWWTDAYGRNWIEGKLPKTAEEDFLTSANRFRKRLLDHPGLLERMIKEGRILTGKSRKLWPQWIQLEDAEFEKELLEYLYERELRNAPAAWGDESFNHPSQPVVGISWYEARAYCRWLSVQTREKFRLLTEVEYEAAARGMEARIYPWEEVPEKDSDHDPSLSNTWESGI